MVPSGLLGKSVVVRRDLGVERLLSSTLLVRVVQVVSVGYGNSVKPDIAHLSTRAHATHY
jgi:ABC-type phosphonate transport system ATPase subunit